MTLFNTFHKLEHQFFSLLSFEQMNLSCLNAYATGVKASNLNPAILNTVNSCLKEDILSCASFYRQKSLPWSIILPDYLCTKDILSLLNTEKLLLIDKGIAMQIVLNPSNFVPSLLNISEMKQALETWSIPLLHGFESTPDIMDIYIKQHQMAVQTNDNIYHFTGFIKGKPICSLTLSIYEDSARLDDIATIPAYQKKGYATELTHAALHHAFCLGIKTCFLEAATSGLNVYKRIGFQPLFTNLYYEDDKEFVG
ncbi:GNAT family acetyltransferase [Legionella busanensis]|uniref:GNAT family acetyltransferase n=1 Tax=Legionella busanensis TaxID=190655 RepID=A0A378JP51_9GAMM|nr:GNAT family N-acetyltransferase [Legionella busanensis]STX51760.1 GNAT family acetyltransferase [Legionella busanensis]